MAGKIMFETATTCTGVIASVKQDRSIRHDPIPMETPQREGRPSPYCRQCGLGWTNAIHIRPI